MITLIYTLSLTNNISVRHGLLTPASSHPTHFHHSPPLALDFQRREIDTQAGHSTLHRTHTEAIQHFPFTPEPTQLHSSSAVQSARLETPNARSLAQRRRRERERQQRLAQISAPINRVPVAMQSAQRGAALMQTPTSGTSNELSRRKYIIRLLNEYQVCNVFVDPLDNHDQSGEEVQQREPPEATAQLEHNMRMVSYSYPRLSLSRVNNTGTRIVSTKPNHTPIMSNMWT